MPGQPDDQSLLLDAIKSPRFAEAFESWLQFKRSTAGAETCGFVALVKLGFSVPDKCVSESAEICSISSFIIFCSLLVSD